MTEAKNPRAKPKKGHPLLRKLNAMSDALPDSAFDDAPYDYSTSYKREFSR